MMTEQEYVMNIKLRADELAKARADIASLRAENERLRKMLRERPTAPHPVDQLNNLAKAMWEDAEKEVAELRASLSSTPTEKGG